MTDKFEDWINDMDEDEYLDRINSKPEDGGFTDKQERIALTIREPASEEELAELERQQESEPIRVEQVRQQTDRVYDTRDIKVVSNQEGDAIVTVNANESPKQIQERLSEPIQSQEIRRQSIASRIKSAIVNAFRRKK